MLLDPLPLSQTVTPSRTPSPSSVTYFMDGPKINYRYIGLHVYIYIYIYNYIEPHNLFSPVNSRPICYITEIEAGFTPEKDYFFNHRPCFSDFPCLYTDCVKCL